MMLLAGRPSPEVGIAAFGMGSTWVRASGLGSGGFMVPTPEAPESKSEDVSI